MYVLLKILSYSLQSLFLSSDSVKFFNFYKMFFFFKHRSFSIVRVSIDFVSIKLLMYRNENSGLHPKIQDTLQKIN